MPTTNASRNLLSLTINQELLQALETKHGQPLALGKAIQEGITKGQLIPYQEFLESPLSVYKKSWSLRPWNIIIQGLRQLGIYLTQTEDYGFSMEKLVILENLEAAGNEAKKRFLGFHARSDKVITRASFVNEFNSVFDSRTLLSESDMDLLLKFLSRDLGLICYNAEIVKWKSSNDQNVITLEDTTVASLKDIIKTIDNQIRCLSQKIEELSCSAKVAISKKNRAAAIAALRSKKLMSSIVEKRYATLAQLEEVFFKIEQASDQVELVKIMEASTEVLTGLNKEVGGVEKVEFIIENLQEQIKLVDEVSTSTEVGNAVDAGEIDDELEAMMQDEKEKTKAREATEKFQDESETNKILGALKETESQFLSVKERPLNDPDLQKDLTESTNLMKDLSLEPKLSNIE